MIADNLRNWRQYFDGAGWTQAFEYLEQLNPDSPDNDRVELLGQKVYARVMSYLTKSPAEAIIEAHNQYIDIQMTLAGIEGIDCFARDRLETKEPYEAARDAVFFHHQAACPAPLRVVNLPGRFAVLFPQDAHMPQLAVGEPSMVRKVVIKISTEFAMRIP